MNSSPVLEPANDYPSAEYLEFLRRVVDQAMISVREGRGRSNEEVNADFAARLVKPLSLREMGWGEGSF